MLLFIYFHSKPIFDGEYDKWIELLILGKRYSFIKKENCCPAPPFLLCHAQGTPPPLDLERVWTRQLWTKTNLPKIETK